jgi:hypothetical protein
VQGNGRGCESAAYDENCTLCRLVWHLPTTERTNKQTNKQKQNKKNSGLIHMSCCACSLTRTPDTWFTLVTVCKTKVCETTHPTTTTATPLFFISRENAAIFAGMNSIIGTTGDASLPYTMNPSSFSLVRKYFEFSASVRIRSAPCARVACAKRTSV